MYQSQNVKAQINEEAPSVPVILLFVFVLLGCFVAYLKGCEYGAVHGFTIDDSKVKFQQSAMGD